MVSASPTSRHNTSHINRRRGMRVARSAKVGSDASSCSICRRIRCSCSDSGMRSLIIARSAAPTQRVSPGSLSEGWSGPHCWAPLRTTRTPSGPTALAGPIAAEPNRSRIWSIAPAARCGASASVEQAQLVRRLDEIAARHAEQPHALRQVERPEHRAQRVHQPGPGVDRARQRHRSRDRTEAGETDLERGRARRRSAASQSSRHGVGEAHQLAFELGQIVAGRADTSPRARSTWRRDRARPADRRVPRRAPRRWAL